MLRQLVFITALAALLLTSPAVGVTITVDAGGGGDYDNIPEAALNATSGDTVLVMPGLYSVVPPDWPIVLHADSPAFVSESGAPSTILEGDGSVPAFHVFAEVFDARTTIVGFTIRNTTAPIFKEFECGGLIHFTDNVLEFNGQGLDAQQGGAGCIARNLIQHNGSFGLSVYHFNGVVEHNEICYSEGDGISGLCCEEPTIRYNHIHDNGESGIDPNFYCYATDNIIENNNEAGVEVHSHAYLYHNLIRGNSVGVRIWADPEGRMDHNDVSGNTTYAVQVMGGGSGRGNYLARYCWWGSSSGDFVRQSIWDSGDDPGISTTITYSPYCTIPGCAVPVEAKSWGAIKALYR